ncbi:MAG TPA: hypothetical protein VLN72_02110 [Gillisia sp.]|nr:hypothetical protein [Gillisia sp.]
MKKLQDLIMKNKLYRFLFARNILDFDKMIGEDLVTLDWQI